MGVYRSSTCSASSTPSRWPLTRPHPDSYATTNNEEPVGPFASTNRARKTRPRRSNRPLGRLIRPRRSTYGVRLYVGRPCVACLVCEAPSTHSAHASGMLQEPDPDNAGRIKLTTLPPMPVCNEHVRALAAQSLAPGWCGTSGRWGEATRTSPCGAPYQRTQPPA